MKERSIVSKIIPLWVVGRGINTSKTNYVGVPK